MFIFALLGCGAELTTSTCSYDTTPGTCTFTEVTADSQVVFTFFASDGSGSESGTLTVGDDALAPDQACIDELGIVVDDVLDCDRKDLTDSSGNGECAAVEWEFDDIDTRDCEF